MFQRVDRHELSQNEALIAALNATTRRMAILLENLSDDVTSVSRELTTYNQRLKKRTWFHNHWGVEKVGDRDNEPDDPGPFCLRGLGVGVGGYIYLRFVIGGLFLILRQNTGRSK